MARADSNYLRDNIATLKSDLAAGDTAAAAHLVAAMQSKAAAAHDRTSGPAWWIGAKLGYLGRPFAAERAQSALLDEVAHSALPAVLRAGEALNPTTLRTGRDQIDLTKLQAAVPVLQAAQTATDAVARRSMSLPGTSWLSFVNHDRTTLVTDLATLRSRVTDLLTASRLLPAALGETGTRRYFVAFETDSEARGIGGLPGAYAILQARNGQVSFTRFGSDVDLSHARSHVNLGRAFADHYGAQYAPQQVFYNSDASPNFPYAARIWMGMWQDRFHQRLDGAIATDPAALSALLGAVGPVRLSDGSLIGSGNAVEFFENSIYQVFAGNNNARKTYLVDASKAVARKVLGASSGDLVATASAMRSAVSQGRLLAYTSDPTIESTLRATPLGGVLPQTTRPFLGVVINNSSGTKLDYYLDRSVTYTRASCTSRDVTVGVTLHNTAPNHGLAPIVLGRGPGVAPPEPHIGEEGLVLSVFGTQGSQVRTVSVNGHTGFFESGTELGHPVTSVHLNINSGQTITTTFNVADPPATGPLLVHTQPAARPTHTTIHAPQCPTQRTSTAQGSPAG
ncbi:MAG TPA: DUF4012 domain-containing protein [Nocardioides sp.]|nr:DUF4012 domain-containing protein [Nocardioides sp.]